MFRATKEHFFKDLMSWTGCQNNLIYLNFHREKSSECFGKNEADKIRFYRMWTKSDLTKTQGGKCPVPSQTGLKTYL